MSNPKQWHSLWNKKRFLLLVVILAVLALCIPTAAVAWLNDFEQTEENVFVKGYDLTITFNESTGADERLVPGDKIAKDPYVTVESGSEPCYLFLIAKENDNTADFLDYEIDDGWSLVDGQTNYYYRIVGDVDDGTLTDDQTFYVLQGDDGTDRAGESIINGYVTCRSEKKNGDDIVNADLASPDVTLSFKTVAIQQQNLVLTKAFEIAKPQLDAD